MSKIVIKIGTNVLTTAEGKLDLNSLRTLVNQIAYLQKERHFSCIIVTSAAITCGSEQLGIKPTEIGEKQAAAAIGQSLLMKEYSGFLSMQGLKAGQILLTKDAIEDPERLKNILNTINTLLGYGVIPIINENDSVSTAEIKIGDNDELSSLVAKIVKADRYVLLTNTDGLYKNFDDLQNRTLIHEVHDVDAAHFTLAGGPTDHRSSGGMFTKLKAAQSATEVGILTKILNGRHPNILIDSLESNTLGTTFYPKK